MTQQILAIDPGASGGLAWTYGEGLVHAANMPDGMTEQADLIRELAVNIDRCVIENVGGYRPGNSGPASVKFARHCGNLEVACYMVGLPTTQVAPGTWMKSIGVMPKDKTARKKAIKEEMARRYPHLKVTLKTSDALGILTWAMKKV